MEKSKRRAARPTEARERARAALKVNPDASLTAVAELAGVSRGTVVNARAELAKEARKEARKVARDELAAEARKRPAEPSGRRERAQRFLREQLARGANRATNVDEAAAKAHIDDQALTAARADLGIVATRSNAGVQAVQWSLPG